MRFWGEPISDKRLRGCPAKEAGSVSAGDRPLRLGPSVRTGAAKVFCPHSRPAPPRKPHGHPRCAFRVGAFRFPPPATLPSWRRTVPQPPGPSPRRGVSKHRQVGFPILLISMFSEKPPWILWMQNGLFRFFLYDTVTSLF